MRRTTAAVVGVLALAGCAGDPGGVETGSPETSAPPAEETAFLVEARALEATVEGDRADDAQLLKMGYIVCKALKDGDATENQRVTWAVFSYPGELGVVSAAETATTLCPEWFKE